MDVESSPEWIAFTEVFVHGEYDAAIDHVVNSSHCGDCPTSVPLVLDLGAHVGYFTIKLFDRWWKIHGRHAELDVVAVEGSPRTFETLSRRLQQDLLSGRVNPHLGLVGDRTGAAVIHDSTDSISSSIFDGPGRKIKNPFLDLEQVIPAGRRIALLKCDIEGAEERFLTAYGSLLNRVDAIAIELHGHLCSTARCRRLLAQAGFTEKQTLKIWGSLTSLLLTRLENLSASP